jgi:dihydroorotase-like cyclic amidohydrolase
MISRGRNSCFLGNRYSGWPVMTIVGGRFFRNPA